MGEQELVSRLLAERSSRAHEVELYEARRRGGWQRAPDAEAAADFVVAVDTDAWWAGDVALWSAHAAARPSCAQPPTGSSSSS